MSRELRTVVEDLHFSECPRWHDDRLFFSDFYLQQVLSVAYDGSDLRVEAEVPGQPSGLGWLPDGRLLVVSQHDTRLLRREPDGTLVTHADLARPRHRRPQRHGRRRAGPGLARQLRLRPDGWRRRSTTATLTRVDPDGTATTVAEDLYFPNGSVIIDGHPDRRRDLRQPDDRLRHRRRRLADQPAGVGGVRRRPHRDRHR